MVKYIFIATPFITAPLGERWGEIFKFKTRKAALRAAARIEKEGNTISGIVIERD